MLVRYAHRTEIEPSGGHYGATQNDPSAVARLCAPCYHATMSRATRREKRLQQLDEQAARIRAEQRRLRALTSREERKRDTRRLILMGAMLRDRMARGDLTEKLFQADMDRFLVQDRDRELFGLSPRQSSETGEPQP